MKITGNCTTKHCCPFLRNGIYHPGYTGKSGPETWVSCLFHKEYQRNIDVCHLSANYKKQKEAWMEHLKNEREKKNV